MSTLKNRLAVATVATVGFLAVAAPLAPAMAQVYFGVGPFGVDVGTPPPPAYYYGPYGYPYYWHHPHYYHYYGW
jgi:hypothetical protein